jgi:hypothetical protein
VGEYVVAFLWNPSFLSWGSFFIPEAHRASSS